MGFEVVPRKAGRNGRRQMAGVTAGMLLLNKNQRGLEVMIGADVGDAMGWAKGSRVDIAWGMGPDLGKVRITTADPGSLGLLRPTQSATLRLRTSRVATRCPADRKIAMAPAKYVIEDGALIVTLPPAMVNIKAAAE